MTLEVPPGAPRPQQAGGDTTPAGAARNWALILGASSGFGEAAALALARSGMNIAGVHLDRRATMPNVERIVGAIRELGREALFFNVNAADADKRREVLDQLGAHLTQHGGEVRVLLHSLAFGTLRPFIAREGVTGGVTVEARSSAPSGATIDDKAMNMTLDVMAHSLVYWAQDVVGRKLMGRHGRIFAMTSSGGTRVWPTYGAVSAAKAALESHCRQLALELAPLGITANAIRAGVTDTPALRKIPGNEQMMKLARERNPAGRLTTPEDVAKAIAVLSHPDLDWMTGNTLGIDGGEDIVG